METQTQCDVEDSAAFCSVLNVVIDSGMEEPTPLEPDEFDASFEDTTVLQQEKNDKPQLQPNHQKVPVIRIFGPVLRRNAVNPPLQCTYRFLLSIGKIPTDSFLQPLSITQLLVYTFTEPILT